jgi:tetratricopeptide (TPR) repeat protein
LKRYDEALYCYNKAVELGFKQKMYNYKGDTLMKLKRFEEAIECFNKDIELNSEDYNAFLGREKFYFILNNLTHL